MLRDPASLLIAIFLIDETTVSLQGLICPYPVSYTHLYRNELELKSQALKRPFFQDFESEQYAFYYENKILELVAKGDLDTLKQGVAKIGCSVIPTWHNDSVRTEKNYTIVIPVSYTHLKQQ